MEEEYAAFKKELEDAENEQEKENDVEEETFSLERDVSHIDEHVSCFLPDVHSVFFII